MATLTADELTKIRRAAAYKAREQSVELRWIKACLHDSAQAVEDILASSALATQISSAIDSASSPYGVTFSAQEKRWVAALVMEVKYSRDIIG